MAITHYQNGGEAEVLSSSSMFYYSSDGHWRNVADHANANYVIPEYKEGVVNNGRVEVAMILRNMCHFMDGSFVKTSLLGDTGAGMALLLWESGGKYYNPKTTCELTLID